MDTHARTTKWSKGIFEMDVLALVIFFIKQYNTLQKLTVEIKEARANIILAYEK